MMELKGEVYNIRVYSRVLTPEEIWYCMFPELDLKEIEAHLDWDWYDLTP